MTEKKMRDIFVQTFSEMPMASKKLAKNPCKGLTQKSCSTNEDCTPWAKGCRLKSVNVRQVNHMKNSIRTLEDLLKNLPQNQEKHDLEKKISELKSQLQHGFQLPPQLPPQLLRSPQVRQLQVRQPPQPRQQQNRDLKKSNAQLEQENQRLNATVVELEDVIAENNRRIKALNLGYDRDRHIFEQAKADYDRLDQEMLLLEANYKRIHDELRKCQQQMKQQVKQQIKPQIKQQIKPHKLNQELEQCHKMYDEISDKLAQKDGIINKLTEKLRSNQSEIEELKIYVSEQDQNLQEVESKNYNLRLDLQRFTRMKDLMARRDQLTENQQAQFRDILYSI